jgi:hypothetical protein
MDFVTVSAARQIALCPLLAFLYEARRKQEAKVFLPLLEHWMESVLTAKFSL